MFNAHIQSKLLKRTPVTGSGTGLHCSSFIYVCREVMACPGENVSSVTKYGDTLSLFTQWLERNTHVIFEFKGHN